MLAHFGSALSTYAVKETLLS